MGWGSHLSIIREDLSEAEIFLLRPSECKGQPGSKLGEETSARWLERACFLGSVKDQCG